MFNKKIEEGLLLSDKRVEKSWREKDRNNRKPGLIILLYMAVLYRKKTQFSRIP